eukprot:226267-Rhodomonas_salina.5
MLPTLYNIRHSLSRLFLCTNMLHRPGGHSDGAKGRTRSLWTPAPEGSSPPWQDVLALKQKCTGTPTAREHSPKPFAIQLEFNTIAGRPSESLSDTPLRDRRRPSSCRVTQRGRAQIPCSGVKRGLRTFVGRCSVTTLIP